MKRRSRWIQSTSFRVPTSRSVRKRCFGQNARRKDFIPYYKKACAILHEAGKLVSTHLDGNFRGYLDFITETGFDLLDGCTPAPMFNYEPEEMAAATSGGGGKRRMSCYCGVPASLFTTGADPKSLADFSERIASAFGGRVIVNVGDILPPNGSIGGVIEVGRRPDGLRLA